MRSLRSTPSLQITPSAAACEPLESRQCNPKSTQRNHLARLALAAALLVVVLFHPAQALAKACCEGSAIQGSSITRAFKGTGSNPFLDPCACILALSYMAVHGQFIRRKSILAVSPQACWISPCTLTSTSVQSLSSMGRQHTAFCGQLSLQRRDLCSPHFCQVSFNKIACLEG